MLRAIRRAERVGQAMRDRVRQDRDRIGAARGRGKAGDGGAQDVGLGVAARSSCETTSRHGCWPCEGGIEHVSCTTRPEPAQRPDLGDRQELVLVDAEREADMRRGIDERLPRLLEHAQIATRRRPA